MNANDVKLKLQSVIEHKLLPLIDNDYVYWDLPYHINIGDTLIWQGTLDFLEKTPYEMLDYGNSTTANLTQLKKETVILLHGGGNFGDIYGSSQNFRKKVVAEYPNNKIIILPQTIHFKDKKVEENDLSFFSQHKNIYLCVRDKKSYDIAKKYLRDENVLFLPDMAFCIKDKWLPKDRSVNKKLLMNRIDVEAVSIDQVIVSKVDVQADWPTFEKVPIYCNYLKVLLSLGRRLSSRIENNKLIFLFNYIDKFAMNYVRKRLIRSGVDFINGFDEIYTTRLHGCILSLLLDKKIILLDNSYGKNKAYYDAWLTDSDNIKVESC